MVLEIGCPTCGRTLRVGEESQGKQIRCPACQQISVAPRLVENSAPEPDAKEREATTWHLRTPEGAIYGPIGWDEVVAWAAEGRIAADCQLGESREGPWCDAAELIDVRPAAGTQTGAAAAAPTAYPWTGAALAPPGAAMPVAYPYARAGGYVAPHRGGLVLVLGLLGFMSCPVFSLIAWVMGSHDLREMRAGRMDKSGESLTLAGMMLGMILSLIWIVILLGSLAIMLIWVAARL